MIFDKHVWVVMMGLLGVAWGRGWRWPEGAESVRIDTKVRFVDDTRPDRDDKHRDEVQSDVVPFRQPTETEGFYNRPGNAGRYPVRVETSRGSAAYRVDKHQVFPVQVNQQNDGTLDSLQYCKCVSTPECNARPNSADICGVGKYLCCFKRPNKIPQHNNEFFNEIEDERPMLLPSRENIRGPFPPPPDNLINSGFGEGELGPDEEFSDQRRPVLVGPEGPTGQIGPNQQQLQPILVGPDGPTGVIGPEPNQNIRSSASAQRGVLVGPGGPTGVIGPYNQRPILTGPGGPTGLIGPRGGRGGSRGVLVGPGGPTGIIGPRGYGRQSGPGILVGPGGPTGIIGPGRQLLVGPGGPTGRIGPQQYYDDNIKQLNERAADSQQIEQHSDRGSSKRSTHSTTNPTSLKNEEIRHRIMNSECFKSLIESTERARMRRSVRTPLPPAKRQGCTRQDNSCGSLRQTNFKTIKGERRHNGNNNTLPMAGTTTIPSVRELFTQTTTTTTTRKPLLFRPIKNYLLLLLALRVIIAFGIV